MSPRPALGIIVSDDRMEIAGINGDGTVLSRFGMVELPQGMVIRGEIKDAHGLVAKVKELRQKAKVAEGEEVVLGIGDDKVFLQSFGVLATPQLGVEEAVKWKAKNLSPVYEMEVVSNWRILGKGEGEAVEVLWAGALKQILDSYIEVLRNGGLAVVVVEPEMLGVIRAIEPEQLTGKSLLIVYAGSRKVQFLYVLNGGLRFSSSVAWAELNVQGGWEGVVRNVMNYVRGKFKTREIEELLLTGEVALGTIYRQLEILKIPLVVAKARVGEVKAYGGIALSNVTGLALRDVEEEEIDLLPQSQKEKKAIERVEGVWFVSGVLLLLFSLLAVGWIWWWGSNLQEEITYGRVLVNELKEQNETPARNQTVEAVGEFNELIDKLSLAADSGGGEEKLLLDLAETVPVGVRLTSYLVERGKESGVSLEKSKPYWVVTGIANNRDLVLSFYRALTARETYSGGRLFFGSLDKGTEVEFRIASQYERQR